MVYYNLSNGNTLTFLSSEQYFGDPNRILVSQSGRHCFQKGKSSSFEPFRLLAALAYSSVSRHVSNIPQLLTVAHERNSIYEDISNSTRGVMFMGTPHFGSDLANWTRVLRNIGNFCTAGSVRIDLLKGLESKSAELAELSMQFIDRGNAIKIVSVYEGKSLARLIPVVCF